MPQARQAKASGENLNYVTLAPVELLAELLVWYPKVRSLDVSSEISLSLVTIGIEFVLFVTWVLETETGADKSMWKISRLHDNWDQQHHENM